MRKRITIFIAMLVTILLLFTLTGCTQNIQFGKKEVSIEGTVVTYISPAARFVRWSPNGEKLAVVDESGLIRIHHSITKLEFDYIDNTGSIRYSSLAWSPDGNKIYYFETPFDEKNFTHAPDNLLYSYDLGNRKITLKDEHYVSGLYTDVTPDGKSIIVTRDRKGLTPLVEKYDLDTGVHTDILDKFQVKVSTENRLSRDGKRLFVKELRDRKVYGKILDLENGKQWVISDYALNGATWSPDGKWIAYTDNIHDIYIISTDGHGEPKKILSNYYAVQLDWSPKGDKLAFATGNLNRINSTKLYLLDVPKEYQ